MAQAETAISEAFARAGRKSPIRIAEQAADEVLDDVGGDYEEAFRLFLAALIEAGASAVVAAVGDDTVRRALMDFLGKRAALKRGQVPVSGHVRGRPGTRSGGQPALDARKAVASADASGAGLARSGTRGGTARAAGNNSGPTAAERAAESSVARKQSRSLLLSICIGSLPLRECTKGAVLASADGDVLMARFKRNLVGPLPTDSAVVGDFVDDDWAEQCMTAARENADAA